MDLWTQISNIIVSRGPNAFQVVKVKSHQNASEAKTSLDAWIIRGNEKADELAKNQMLEVVQANPDLHDRARLYERFVQDAIQCSHLLQEISQKVFQARKEQEHSLKTDRNSGPGQEPLEDDDTVFSCREISFVNIPSSSMWDPRWLEVVAHDFSILRWPDPEPVNARPVTLLELMLDSLIAFQIRPPVNMRLFNRRHTLPPGVDTSSYTTQYVLFPRRESELFPQIMLTDASYIWIRTFDFLQPIIQLTPHPRASLYTLGNFGFCNSSPSIPVRPQLLCGHLVSQLLASTLVPGVRVVRYPLVITPAEPRPLPSSLFFLGRCSPHAITLGGRHGPSRALIFSDQLNAGVL